MGDVVDESIVEWWFHIEEDKDALEVQLQDAAQAMQIYEREGESTEVDQQTLVTVGHFNKISKCIYCQCNKYNITTYFSNILRTHQNGIKLK